MRKRSFVAVAFAALLAVGYTLDELRNEMTGGKTPASFEPAIDYVVTKVPRFAFEKFPAADDRLTTQMKSVGEVMAIGRTFEESLQKALRGLETGKCGLDPITIDKNQILREIAEPGPERLFYVADGFRIGMTVDEIFELSKIDRWFLRQIEELVQIEKSIEGHNLNELDENDFWALKSRGFSDKRIAALLADCHENEVREARRVLGVEPVFKRVDTCAAEFATTTAYLYSTFERSRVSEAAPTDRKKVIVLGGGPNRIGQGIEFDYCCVHASMALHEDGWESIMVNCNPETVSTDYDTSDRLYFEPLTAEDVLSIYEKEKPLGVIAQFGGQTPLNLARELEAAGVTILGTSPEIIDLAEDRDRFRAIMDSLDIPMPEAGMAVTTNDALEIAHSIGYPVMVRPSYVLGGRGMEVVYDDENLRSYMAAAVGVTPDRPILIDRFLNHALECEADAICDGTNAFVPAVMEHVELAGVHSGDSAAILPSVTISDEHLETIKSYTKKIAEAMHVVGLMNIQYAIEGDTVYVLEANPRASRTVPLVSKVCGIQMVQIATEVMTAPLTGLSSPVPRLQEAHYAHYGVKEAVFPFNMFPEVDPVLGPEMRSTGEVLGLAPSFGEAFFKSQEATQTVLPLEGTVLISVSNRDKEELPAVAQAFIDAGFRLATTQGTHDYLSEQGIDSELVKKSFEGHPNLIDLIEQGDIAMVINTPSTSAESAADDSYIRKTAIKAHIPYMTTMAAALASAQGIKAVKETDKPSVMSLQEIHAHISYE